MTVQPKNIEADQQQYALLEAVGTQQSAAQIASLFVAELPADRRNGERTWSYTDSLTRREFEVRRSTGLNDGLKPVTRYFLSEYVPNGMVCRWEGERLVSSRKEPRVREFADRFGPNELYARLEEAGVEVAGLVRMGSGFSTDSVYYESLETCAEAVAECLARNEWYCSHAQPSQQQKIRRLREQAQQSAIYWRSEREQLDWSLQKEHGIFKGCLSMMGPLAPETKTQILAYLNAPGNKSWLQARGLVITGVSTLWQAWCESDPSAPTSGDKGYPNREALQQAIRQAVQTRSDEIDRELAEANPNGLSLV